MHSGGEYTDTQQRGRVVVGVSGPADDEAVTWAAGEAGRRGCDLVLLHAGSRRGISTGRRPSPVSVLENAERLAQRQAPDLRIRQHLADGRPGPALLAESRGASCLVIGAGGRGFMRSSHGSSADYLLRHVPCPLVIVRGPSQQGSGVVVGVDGSIASRGAMIFAAQAAHERGLALSVAHVWSGEADDDHGSTSLEELMNGMMEAEIALVRKQFPALEVHLVCHRGSPARELARLAGSAQLLVVGSHCRGSVGAAVFGSVSASLVRSSPCPIAVVRPFAVTSAPPPRATERSIV
jgi:nucleotide-binding universal stress UspA family protein